MRQKSEAGQALAVTSLTMVLLMSGAGLSLDMGYLRYVQRRAQNAADSAAVAATAELLNGDYVSAGQNDAASNGFTDGSNNVTVAVNYPPTLGIYANQSNFVEVIITQTVPTFFMKVAGYSTETVTARAVGHYWSGTNCIYALSPSTSGALTVSGGINLDADCGVIVDSDSSTAEVATGGSSVVVTANMVTGGVSDSSGGTISPRPTTGVPPEPDPLGYLSEPTVGSCTYTQKYQVSSPATINPGVYCGGLTVSATTANFTSGTYIIEGSGLTISGSSTVTGSKVMFYITGDAPVNISGSSSCNLSAPTTGTYAGVLFFQDRTDSQRATISGGTSSNFVGALYFSDANLVYSGGTSDTAYTILVANTITISGQSTLNDNYASLTNGSPVKSATLAE